MLLPQTLFLFQNLAITSFFLKEPGFFTCPCRRDTVIPALPGTQVRCKEE